MGEPYAEAAVGRRLQQPGWEATGQDGEFPTGVGQQLRQVRHGFIAVDFSCKWELKQRGRVCPLGCDCEQCRPLRDPGRLCSRPEVGRHGGCPLPGEQAQEGCSLVARASSMPITTRRQRRARVSSGYVSRLLRRAALFAAHPGCVSARGCASPDRVTGETMVASRASCDPCHKGKPLATTSISRASATGTSIFMSATQTFRETRAPASRQTLATARSSGSAREASTPIVAQAVRWSPSASRRPWQPQRHGGSGSRRRRRRSTRNCALGMTTPS